MARVISHRPRTKVSPPRVARTVRLPPDLDSRLYRAAQRRRWAVHDTILAALVAWLDREDAQDGAGVSAVSPQPSA